MTRRSLPSPLLRCAMLLCIGLLSVSCRNRSEQTIEDSEGRHFLVQCSQDHSCTVAEKPTDSGRPSATGSTSTAVMQLRSSGRVIGVCGPLPPEHKPAPADCRPIVCADNRDCPASEGLSDGACINGICTEPSHEITSGDAVMLCLAGTGAQTLNANQVERLALGLNCGTPCRIPRPCRQL
ncbi:MAG TPA: hypothetical protein VIV60_25130 [Polyangiaceae bacterium]